LERNGSFVYPKLALDKSDLGESCSRPYVVKLLRPEGLQECSERGSCDDNALAKSVFPRLKRQHIRKQHYVQTQEARNATFSYIEMF
jgi:hypothetical protein